jgi:hypothetical protein
MFRVLIRQFDVVLCAVVVVVILAGFCFCKSDQQSSSSQNLSKTSGFLLNSECPFFAKAQDLLVPLYQPFVGVGFFSFQQIMGGSNHCPQEEEEGMMGQNFKELQGK